MATGTKLRILGRLLDASDSPLWVIGPGGNLAYLSAGVSSWLGIDAEQLLDRRSVAGSPISDDPLDYIAASMSPPPGFVSRGMAALRIQPPPLDGRKIPPLDVRFVRLGVGETAVTMAIAGSFAEIESTELRDAVAVRQCLDRWRKRHAAIATIATAGVSATARRLRARLHVAGSTRTHIGFFGPPGCGAESIAARIHQLSSPAEPIVTVDGPLMDAELLDATVVPLVNQLASSSDARATALVRGLDHMPSEAGQRLAELLSTFSGRLRLLAICGARPKVLREPLTEDSSDDPLLSDEPETGITAALLDCVAAFTVTMESLSSRVEDIPVIAAAIVDSRRAAGEGTAERISRAALDSLVMYPWPNNYVELDDAMRHALRAAPGETIGVEHLPLAVRSFHVGQQPVISKTPKLSLDESLKRLELLMIEDALAQAEGNRAEAARLLGISRARLLRRLEENAGGEHKGGDLADD